MKRKNIKSIILASIIILTFMFCTLILNAEVQKKEIEFTKDDFVPGLKLQSPQGLKAKFVNENHVNLSSIDHSSEMPGIYNQGKQGSCTGFSNSYYNAYQEYKNHGFKKMFSPAYIYNQINNGVDDGATMESALYLLKDKGVCFWDTMLYNQFDFLTQPNQAQHQEASNYKAKEVYYLSADINGLKSYLENDCFEIGLSIYNDFINLNDSNNQVFDNISGQMLGGHAICVVGFDDSKQAFKIINSWGTGWGNDGYGYISYSIWNSVVGDRMYCMEDEITGPTTSPTTSPTPTIEETPTTSPTINPTPTKTPKPKKKNKIIFNGAKTISRKGTYGAGNQWKFVMKNESKSTIIKQFKKNGYPIWIKKDASLISSYDGCYIKITEIDSPYSKSDHKAIKINKLKLGKNIIYLTVKENKNNWTKWKVAITRKLVN
jgi:hypothetical protein